MLNTLLKLSAFLTLAAYCFYSAAIEQVTTSTDTATDTSEMDYQQLVSQAEKTLMIDPNRALELAQQAESIALSELPQIPQDIAKSLWLQGESLNRLRRRDELEDVLARAFELLDESDSNSSLYANLLLTKARSEQDLRKIKESLESYNSAYSLFLALNDKRKQAIVLQDIAAIYNLADLPEKTREYHSLSAKAYRSPDKFVSLVLINNRAITHAKLEDFDRARVELLRGLEIAKSMQSQNLEARITLELSNVEGQTGNYVKAEAYVDRAISIFTELDMQNWVAISYQYKAKNQLGLGNIVGAQKSIEMTLGMVPNESAITEEMSETAFIVYQKLGMYELALKHHIDFKNKEEQNRSVITDTRTAVLAAEFESTQKQLQIEALEADQQLTAFKLEAASARARFQHVVIGMTVAAVIIMFFLSFNLLRSRNKQKALNDELSITIKNLNREVAQRSAAEAQLKIANSQSIQN